VRGAHRGVVLATALALAGLSVAASVLGEVPRASTSTPLVTIAPTWTPEQTYPPLEPVATEWIGPSPVLYVTPTPNIKLPAGAPYFGKCPSPSTSTDRRRSNSPAAQSYLRSRLNLNEYNCAWWIILQESGWRPTALNWQGACGFPQAYPCSKLANFIAARHPDEPPYHKPGLIVTWAIDWSKYPTDQLDWMICYVKGCPGIKAKYGSFLVAASLKFGYYDAEGAHAGRGWY